MASRVRFKLRSALEIATRFISWSNRPWFSLIKCSQDKSFWHSIEFKENSTKCDTQSVTSSEKREQKLHFGWFVGRERLRFSYSVIHFVSLLLYKSSKTNLGSYSTQNLKLWELFFSLDQVLHGGLCRHCSRSSHLWWCRGRRERWELVQESVRPSGPATVHCSGQSKITNESNLHYYLI